MIVINIFFLIIILFFQDRIIKFYNNFINIKKVPNTSKKPLLGGFFIIINILLYFSLSFDELNQLFSLNIDKYIFLLCCISIFIIGAYDDLFLLSPSTRIIFISSILFFFLSSIDYYQIFLLKLQFVDYSLSIERISIFFTLFCFVVLINSINLFDGINGQSGLYFFQIFLLIYFKGVESQFIFLLLISLFIFLILNIRNKIYMGDSGIYLLSFILGVFLINGYHSGSFTIEEIILLCLVHILDLTRLFFLRLFLLKNPFLGDKKHIHHTCIVKYGYFLSIVLIQLHVTIPLIINYFFNFYCAIIFSLIFYGFLVLSKARLPRKIRDFNFINFN